MEEPFQVAVVNKNVQRDEKIKDYSSKKIRYR